MFKRQNTFSTIQCPFYVCPTGHEAYKLNLTTWTICKPFVFISSSQSIHVFLGRLPGPFPLYTQTCLTVLPFSLQSTCPNWLTCHLLTNLFRSTLISTFSRSFGLEALTVSQNQQIVLIVHLPQSEASHNQILWQQNNYTGLIQMFSFFLLCLKDSRCLPTVASIT